MTQIIYVITTIERGGAEVQLLQAATALRKKVENISIIFLKGKPELYKNFSELGCEVVDLSAVNFFTQTFFMRKYISAREKAVVHAHLPRSEIVAVLATLFLRQKLVITRHNSERFWPSAPKALSSLLSRIVLGRATKIVAISNAVLEFLKNNREIRNICLSKVSIVYYGFSISNNVYKKEIETDNLIRIGTIARLEKQKDLKTLLKAVAILDKRRNISLRIVGEGSQRKVLENLSVKLGVSAKTLFLGKTDLIEDFLRSIDVFVLTSKYEGFGAVLVEAMKEGVPIIVANTSSVPEVMGKDYPGLCKEGDYLEIASLILKAKDPVFAESCKIRYPQQLEKFKVNAMATNLMCIYGKVLSE